MVSAALLLLAAVQIVLLAAVPVRGRGIAPPLLLAVGAGLAYDSVIFGLGAFLGEGDPLHWLSTARYAGHTLLTPLLVIWAATLLERSRTWAAVLTAILVAWGLALDVAGLELVPRAYADTLRHVPAEPGGPPVPAIVVIVVLFVIGLVLWRGRRWPWLATGALVMFAASAVAFAAPPLGNLGEALLFAAIVATERGTGPATRGELSREAGAV